MLRVAVWAVWCVLQFTNLEVRYNLISYNSCNELVYFIEDALKLNESNYKKITINSTVHSLCLKFRNVPNHNKNLFLPLLCAYFLFINLSTLTPPLENQHILTLSFLFNPTTIQIPQQKRECFYAKVLFTFTHILCDPQEFHIDHQSPPQYP